MFGHLDKGIFLELCRSIETLSVLAGQFLFRIGDPDEFIHVVQVRKTLMTDCMYVGQKFSTYGSRSTMLWES